MDPVNKWLTVIISFMIALLIVISWKAGSGRYEMSVQKSVVYVLDTKTGTVYAKQVDEDILQSKYGVRYPQEVFKLTPGGY